MIRELSIRGERFASLEFEGHPSVSVDTEKLKTVTPNSVIHYHAVIYQALKYAMKTDLVTQNVAMKVDRRKRMIISLYSLMQKNCSIYLK